MEVIKNIREALRDTPLDPLVKWTGKTIRNYKRPKISRMNQIYDEQALKVMQRVPGNYLDVGCHKGKILKKMLEIAPSYNHIAFEPLPQLAKELRAKFPTVQIHEVALGDHAGTHSFQVVKNYLGRSGMKKIDYPGQAEIETIIVAMDTIDNLVHSRVDLIKIDVEGAEYNVLKGAERTIRENKPIIVFEHGLAAMHYDVSSDDIFDFLGDCGLDIYLMTDWLRGKKPLTKKSFHGESTMRNWYFLAAPKKSSAL